MRHLNLMKIPSITSLAGSAFWTNHSKKQLSRTATLVLALASAGCTNAPLREANSLRTYNNLSAPSGKITKARIWVDSNYVLSAKTVKIVSTTISGASTHYIEKSKDRFLVTNAVDRALCISLSDRFEVVGNNQPSDLIVHAVITNVIPTNATVAGISTATSLGSSIVLPVSVPRIPFGLGGLSMEAEAIGKDGQQKAAMVWARGANMIMNKPRVSRVSDAHSLASNFGNDFSKMLVKGKSPFKGWPSLPSGQKIRSSLGGKPKYLECDRFGRAPGIPGAVADELGFPPDWTDKGARYVLP